MGRNAEQLEKGAENRVTESGFRTRTRLVPVLRKGALEFRLDRPSLTIGRSAACEVQVESGLVSRRHARLTVTHLGVTVEDLDSRNGVFVNSVRALGPVRLRSGDRLAVGDEVLVFGEAEEPVDIGHDPTLAALPAQRVPRDAFADDDVTLAIRSTDVFELLAGVVDKALGMGRGEEAEHLISAHLHSALKDATNGRPLSPEVARRAAGYAVKLAGATGKASWLDHAIRLYAALDLVLPLALVDEMYVLLRRVRGLDLDELRRYTERLRPRAAELAPAERFVLQRLIGLERLAAWQTNAPR